MTAPRSANINAASGDGAIRAEAIEDRIVLRTTDGSVTATWLGGDVQTRSGDGSIRIDNATGKLDLETDDGSVGGSEADGAAPFASIGDAASAIAAHR